MVKFDIISGFLGAGKTTFIKKILNSVNRHEKIVIIENEFGEVSVDREFLEIEGYEIYELSNGCVCCKLKGDFLLTLKQILNQKVDRIIFEPSGIFILSEITDLFKDFEISSKCFINTVITVVDAENFSEQIQSYSYFFKSQIINASTLVVSKTKFLKPKEVDLIKKELRALNNTAMILAKDWAEIYPQEILDLIDNNPARTLYGDTHSSGHDFETLGIRTSRVLEFNQLKKILEKCIEGAYGNIIRGKGIIKSGDTFLEFQYVGEHFTISESKNATVGVVSFIGNNLQKVTLKEAFL
ncbi:CobW family GTP-binding protein [Desulfosporosinus metallidurans]|uniref:Putative metal chaperone, involved in Zn homeostasis, GTPase of COG0523 family n=1 Tax=Desulfosporosinus metallidurans TaxID=1888891 RepID=A0A1Q8QFN5_9FIRM|nr:GTP-binding protein [Desulfosporosinus metallidurans]OLN26149.1 putative metal chaperone, involved in Zn homeostasis, GTPase of COG0523 family [Desulfosporosinus metallidurans]